MNIKEYMQKNEKTLEQASQELGFSYEDMRRYSQGLVFPRPERIIKITEWSGGEVTANDFINNYETENEKI